MADTLIDIDRAVSTAKPRRIFKTMLLFPPEWVPTAPYLSLPSLTAVLRAYGHQVIQKDINIEMYDLFFYRHFSHLGEDANGSATSGIRRAGSS